MGRYAVYIATTSGPSRVQDIRVDESLSYAVLTVNFRPRRASVSNEYAEFVSRDAGVIETQTGECRYRARISRDIERGDSWQLGMLAAHSLNAVDQLAMIDAPEDADTLPDLTGADGVIWATGTLTDQLRARFVSSIALKLERSRSLFEACGRAGVPVRCFFPADVRERAADLAGLETQIEAARKICPQLEVVFVDQAEFSPGFWTGDAQEVASQVVEPRENADEEALRAPSAPAAETGGALASPRNLAVLGMVAVVALAGVAAMWFANGRAPADATIAESGELIDPTPAPAPTLPGLPTVNVEVASAGGEGCYVVGGAARQTRLYALEWGGAVEADLGGGVVCRLRVSGDGEGGDDIAVQLASGQTLSAASPEGAPVGTYSVLSPGEVADGKMCLGVSASGDGDAICARAHAGETLGADEAVLFLSGGQ